MRHKLSTKKLNRNTKQRKALFRSLIGSLIMREEIHTTESKAKAIRKLIEKLINKAKTGSLGVRRQIHAFLPNREVVNKLVDDIAPRFKQTAGGFVRLIRLGVRKGDNSMMVKMELTQKKPAEKKSDQQKTSEKKLGKKENPPAGGNK